MTRASIGRNGQGWPVRRGLSGVWVACVFATFGTQIDTASAGPTEPSPSVVMDICLAGNFEAARSGIDALGWKSLGVEDVEDVRLTPIYGLFGGTPAIDTGKPVDQLIKVGLYRKTGKALDGELDIIDAPDNWECSLFAGGTPDLAAELERRLGPAQIDKSTRSVRNREWAKDKLNVRLTSYVSALGPILYLQLDRGK